MKAIESIKQFSSVEINKKRLYRRVMQSKSSPPNWLVSEIESCMGGSSLELKGIYSFFNGICAENIIFQGVACQVIKLQLEQMEGCAFETEFYPMSVDCKDAALWDGTPFRYYFRSDYHLPLCRRQVV